MEFRITEADMEKLKKIQKSIDEGIACTIEKQENLRYLDSIMNPRCSVCRKPLDGDFEILKNRKMHKKCKKRYKG